MDSYNTDDIIYALATGWIKSAIAVIRVSGNGCIEKFSSSFRCKGQLIDYSTNTAVFGHFFNRDTKESIDDCIVTIYRDGHGYTGEESLEISVHGGLQTIKTVLEYLPKLGFRQAKGGEFTLRAFLHSKMDLTKAEAVNELINSQGNTARLLALQRLSGSLYSKINEIKAAVLDIMSTVEVQLDYAEDEIGEDLTFPVEKLNLSIDSLKKISSTYKTGKLYSQGARVVLAGAANAGKSSLFNLFLKEERAIVSSVKGTTRDYIEAQCNIEGIPVRLYDTAGLRESLDLLEEEGIKRSHNLITGADLIIYLIDATEPERDEKITSDPRCITVINKTDCSFVKFEKDALLLSVKTGDGFENLCLEIKKHLTNGLETGSDSDFIIENERQKEDIERAIKALEDSKSAVEANLPLDIVTLYIQDALQTLGEITGEVTTDDILDKIFSGFCVGK